MNPQSNILPSEFRDLEPFVSRWALDNAQARTDARSSATEAQHQAFYEAGKTRLQQALTFLDKKPLDDFTPSETQLMNLMLSFAHVSLSIEVQGNDENEHAIARSYLPITRAPADL